ncbi:KamA family radical SAM protein [Candidatus Vesicomyidisocius sp. SY067_SCS001]|uniref:KamA family radical SAM protein n=1 Tax=Candidatus Vesicomyidisocius sp. SY067_SCS001 TaxID=2732590 RepID=UPI0016882377|nr:KamA family radical SAM protein [Candidatus Vesicomyosocius sp. SY067_SCS001]
MENNWQYYARYALKGANKSNVFFKTKMFKDRNFPIKIPLEFARLIDKRNKDDPLLKQVITPKTLSKSTSFSLSPLEDEKYSPVAGLIHKYPNRVLLIASQVCAIHCQYCFRQNFNYVEHDAISNWVEIQNYIINDVKINEVILSGGDPLSLSDDKLATLVDNIAHIAHIKTLRVHTRSAVVEPSRITRKLVEIFNQSRLNIVIVLHINHAQELSVQFAQKIIELTRVTLLSQSVLLRGVNDSIEVLTELCLSLFDLGILPYYLHMLDKVKGAQDFLVKDDYAIQLHQQLKSNLSGYLVPKLVRDSGSYSKDWLL